jgi:hypothetical protein
VLNEYHPNQNATLQAKEEGLQNGELRDCFWLGITHFRGGGWGLECKQDAFSRDSTYRAAGNFVFCDKECRLFQDRSTFAKIARTREAKKAIWGLIKDIVLLPLSLTRFLLVHITQPFPEKVQIVIVSGLFLIGMLLIVAWRPELREIVISWAEAIKSLK